MKYFNPTDLVQLDATFNYIAKSGVGFGILPTDEQVFFSARMVDEYKLNVGDTVHVWAVDNHASPNTAHYPSRWRAVRMEVTRRMDDAIRVAPSVSVGTSAEPAPLKPAAASFVDIMDDLLDTDRPWTVNELTRAIAKTNASVAAQPDLIQKVGTRLSALHRSGDVACLKIYSKSDYDRATAVYYASNVDVFYDHLDTPLNDEDEDE